MAVYRGMDIGTAKPTRQEQAAAPHHLIDIVEPHESYSVAQYVEAAERVTGEILSRGRTPIFVGGTPLYLKALLRGIFEGPPADWEFRKHLAAEAALHEPGWLLEQVRAVDPAAAARLHMQDAKRLIRVLEVFEKTGRPISDLQQQFDHARPAGECRVFVLDWPREELYRRINTRVEKMFAAGLVDEVRGLLDAAPDVMTQSSSGKGICKYPSPHSTDGSLSHTARQALGYREVIDHLQGKHALPETIELVQNRTRAFARRQLTWFRSLSECRFVPCDEKCGVADVAEQIFSAKDIS